MKKFLYIFGLVFLFSSCTPRYIEKYSEPLSQSVYANNDSLKNARIDLAWYFSNETTKLVPPPKVRLKIDPVYEKEQTIGRGKKVVLGDGTRILILPEQFSKDKQIIVNSVAYNEILKDKKINNQLTTDLELTRKDFSLKINAQVLADNKVQSELLGNYNKEVSKNGHLEGTIWKDRFIILGLLVIIVGYIALRVFKFLGKLSTTVAPFVL